MAPGFTWDDRYAGDDAWREWFEICSVAGCCEEHAALLRREIESAMFSRLARAGFSRDDVGNEDPVAFFDSYFRLRGSRDSPKPLKAYFAYRIRKEGVRLRDFVCGTLFGGASGRVRDIVQEWISVAKGWKPRTVAGPDGRRRLEWEATAGEVLPDDLSVCANPAEFIDEGPYHAAAGRVLDAVARKKGLEKRHVALLLYVMAQDVSVTEAAVLDSLQVGKSRAYQLKDAVARAVEAELRNEDGAEDPLFARILLEECEAALDGKTRKRLEGNC